jgi:WD40 repeat protein
VALCSWSGDIWLREVGGEELLHEKFESLTRAAFSPDGKLLVVATQRGQLRTWDALTGKPAKNFHGDTFPFFCVRFSPDGKYLVACGGKGNEVSGVKFAVWNVASREQLYTKKVDLVQVDAPIARLAIFSASISPDSQTLATNGENSVALWDLATGARRSQTVETGGFVYCVEFSPDGKLLASVNLARRQANETGGTVTLWDPSTGNAVGTLLGHESQVRALAFTSDGKTLASGGKDRSIRLWDVATRRQTSALQGAKPLPDADGASSAIMAVAWSPDGASVATANEDGQVSIYGLPSRGLLRSWAAHADAAAALAWSPDGKTLVSGGYDKSIKFWNPATGELVRSLDGHTGWILSLAFSPDGQTLASGSYDRSIRLWNVADGQQRRALTGHTATVRSLAFSHAGKLLASGSADQTVRLWNAADGQEQATLAGHQAAVRSVAFSADDRLLASGGEDQTVKVWNVDSHDLRGTLTGHTDMVSAVAFARGALVSTSWDRTLRVWDVDALVSRHRLSAGASAVVALAVAADGRRLLTAGADQSLTLWKSIVIEDQPAQPQYDALPLLRDDFSNKYSLNWTTIREDKSHLSLLTNPGRLTITTQPGSIRGESDNADGTAAKNIFLIGNPLAETSDFSITLAVSKFDPTTFYQQVGLICYDDDDNYLRWSFEYNTDNATSLAVVRETDAVFKHERLMELPAPERFWMRVTKRGGAYECAYSTDGKDFKLAGSRPWGKHPPKYLGFLAGNGANYAAEEIAVCIDSFELSSLPNDNDQKP